MFLPAGRLDHRVTLQTPALATADVLGDQAEAWSDVADVWADVTELGATEHWKQKAAIPEATVQVTIRYHAEVTSRARFLFEGRLLYPLAVTADGRKTQQVCLCKERP